MSDVFVSYKAGDRTRVRPLVDALEADGLTVWWDAHLGGGDAWRDTIQQNLADARCVIVLWSKRSVGPDGSFVRDEATRALRRHVYLPVLIDNVEPPLGFGETQALPLIGWKGERTDARYRALLGAAQSIVAGKPHVASGFAAARAGVSRRTLIAGGVATAAVAGAGGWSLLKPGSAAATDSIAVLPFANLSGDPAQAYFSDGMAEELRSALARIAQLKVIGRISSEAVASVDTTTAARKLKVATILTGSVRQSASTIRISAQLIDGESGVERWSQSYDRAPGDAIKIQSDIAEHVARALTVALATSARAALDAGGTKDAAAQKLLLQAVGLAQGGEKENMKAALSLVDGALSLDQKYAEAYVFKALTLNRYANFFGNMAELTSYRAEALRQARHALRLAPNLASAHHALADIYRGSLKMRLADREYRRALELAPGGVATVSDYAVFTNKLGRSAESLRLSQEAIALDPLNAQSYQSRFYILMGNRSLADAVRFSKQVQQQSPNLFRWPVEVAICLILLGRTDEARRYLDMAIPEEASRLLGESILLARMGKTAEVEAKIDKIKRKYGDAASYQYAEAYAQLGAKDRAFAALDRAWEIRDSGLTSLKIDPLLDPLRSDARFKALVKRLDFP